MSGDSASTASGFIAYVTRPRGGSNAPGPGCVWVVHASGSVAPRRLGCSGRRGVPDTIGGLSWTASGDLEVSPGRVSATPTVLDVYSGRAVAGAIAESDRVQGRRGDGAIVRARQWAEAERTAQLVLTEPDGSTSVLASVTGPEGYSFGEPQLSPDGQWVLLSDIHGRLLIADDRGRQIRELLPPRRSRSMIATPFLTWFQGRPS